MIKRFLYLITSAALMTMCLASCTTETPLDPDRYPGPDPVLPPDQDPDKDPNKDPDPEPPVELKLGQMDLALEVSIEDFAEATKAPASLKDGAEIAFALDGGAKPAGKLKYDASTGQWGKVELNNDVIVKADGGKVCAIHAAHLTVDTAAEGAGCSGNIVYTDAGTYSVKDNVLSISLNLDRFAESRLVINGLSAKAKVMGIRNKTLTSFSGMKFTEFEGSGEGTYDTDSGTLTVEGCLPEETDGKTVMKIQYIEGENAGQIFTREYENIGKAGESVTISGPDSEDQKDSWTDAGRMPTAVKFKNPDTGEFYEDGQEIVTSYDRTSVKIAEIVVLPEDASDKTVSARSSDNSVGDQATDGFVYAWGQGKATITVTTSNGISNTLILNVLDKYITVDGFYYEVLTGGTLLLRKNPDNPYSGDVVIPDAVEYSGKRLPVTEIAGDAFKNNLVTSITFGKNILSLREGAINNCSSLTKVKINKDFKYIDHYNRNFSYCDNLSSIEIEAGNEYLLLEGGVLYCRDDLSQDPHNRCAYVIPTYTDPVVISSNTVEIDRCSIHNVQTPSVTIPGSVKDMGVSLFGGSNTKLEWVKLGWTWTEWYSMKFDGIFRSAMYHLEDQFFNSHPDIKTVKVYVPQDYVSRYRDTGGTWLKAIGNDPSRIIGY